MGLVVVPSKLLMLNLHDQQSCNLRYASTDEDLRGFRQFLAKTAPTRRATDPQLLVDLIKDHHALG